MKKFNGWININKEQGIGSTKVVSAVRKILGMKKVGHGGTLDPEAFGVLPVAVGEGTKTVSYVMDGEKTYEFIVRFGELRDTDDLEGEVIETSEKIPTESEIMEVLPKFIGEIKQTPPIYSAIKVNGKRAYNLARKGEEVELKSRLVKVYDLRFLGFVSEKSAKFSVDCGKGFYIRSLSRDLAESLGTVGCVEELKRTKVGDFKIKEAITLAKLNEFATLNQLSKAIIPVEKALYKLPTIEIDAEDKQRIIHGKVIKTNNLGDFLIDTKIKLICEDRLVAIAEIKEDANGKFIKSVRVFSL